jgi:hypothetical protein
MCEGLKGLLFAELQGPFRSTVVGSTALGGRAGSLPASAGSLGAEVDGNVTGPVTA